MAVKPFVRLQVWTVDDDGHETSLELRGRIDVGDALSVESRSLSQNLTPMPIRGTFSVSAHQQGWVFKPRRRWHLPFGFVLTRGGREVPDEEG